MHADEFVRRLRSCMPTARQLEAQGFSESHIRELRSIYDCPPKANGQSRDNPLLDLLSRYEVAHVEVGMIRLLDAIIETERAWQVGEDEADPLIIDRATGEVRVEEYGTNGYILSRCAKDGDKFLDALLIAACNADELHSGFSREEAAQQCAEAAGGADYLTYWQYIFACAE